MTALVIIKGGLFSCFLFITVQSLNTCLVLVIESKTAMIDSDYQWTRQNGTHFLKEINSTVFALVPKLVLRTCTDNDYKNVVAMTTLPHSSAMVK